MLPTFDDTGAVDGEVRAVGGAAVLQLALSEHLTLHAGAVLATLALARLRREDDISHD